MQTPWDPSSTQASTGHVIERPAGLVMSIARAMSVDRAVVYAVAYRAYQALSGFGSMLIIPLFLSPAVQGYYFTFSSLLAFSALMELGLQIVVMNTASHEWASLGLSPEGKVEGDPAALSRLVSLGRQVFVWYAGASGLFAVVMWGAGYWFFSVNGGDSQVSWRLPWVLLVLFTALGLWAQPFVVMLEGCNQVARVFKYRLVQAPLITAALWGGMIGGLGLWAVPMAAGATFGGDAWILLGRYRRFWAPFFSPPLGQRVHWKAEIWPMQWRLAASSVGGYMMFSLYNPVIFHYHGAVEAGKMGMTLALVNALQTFGMAWSQTKAPQFGMLVAKKEYRALDQMFFKVTAVSFGVVVMGGLVLWAMVVGLGLGGWELHNRLLSPGPTALLVIFAALMQVSYCQSFYLRAHKREPLLAMSLVTGVAQGLLIWWWGAQYGAMGQAVASLVVVAALILPWETAIWMHARRNWR